MKKGTGRERSAGGVGRRAFVRAAVGITAGGIGTRVVGASAGVQGDAEKALRVYEALQ